MAKKKINKTQAVRDYLKDHPGAGSTEIATALTKKGIKITATYAANIKTTINKTRNAKKAAKKVAAVEVAAPVVTEKKPADTITLEQIRKVAQMIKNLGGFARLNDLLGLIKEVGGVKKFKDLADAMTVVETDYIPF